MRHGCEYPSASSSDVEDTEDEPKDSRDKQSDVLAQLRAEEAALEAELQQTDRRQRASDSNDSDDEAQHNKADPIKIRLAQLVQDNSALQIKVREGEKAKAQIQELKERLQKREGELFQLRKLVPTEPTGFQYLDAADSRESLIHISEAPPEAKEDILSDSIPEHYKIGRSQAQMLDMMIVGTETELESLKLQYSDLQETHNELKKKMKAQERTLQSQSKIVRDLMNSSLLAVPPVAVGPINPGKRGVDSSKITVMKDFEKREMMVRGSIFELQCLKAALEADIEKMTQKRGAKQW